MLQCQFCAPLPPSQKKEKNDHRTCILIRCIPYNVLIAYIIIKIFPLGLHAYTYIFLDAINCKVSI